MEYWVEGETGTRVFTLLADGKPLDGTSLSLSLDLFTNAGTRINIAGISWFNAATGKAQYTPQVTDLLVAQSPYRARFKVQNTAGRTVFFPSQSDDIWYVRA